MREALIINRMREGMSERPALQPFVSPLVLFVSSLWWMFKMDSSGPKIVIPGQLLGPEAEYAGLVFVVAEEGGLVLLERSKQCLPSSS